MIDCTITFQTDSASLMLYDKTIAQAAGLTDPERWSFAYDKLEEVRDGRVAGASLGGDGVYKLRLTDGALTQDERDYAVCCLKPLGLKVASGRVCVSGYWFEDESDLCLEVPVGNYMVELYEISFWDSPRWWRDDGRIPVDAPANYVAVLKPHNSPIEVPTDLQLDYLREWVPGATAYLYQSSTRVIGPQVGMEVTSTVRKSGDALVLKDCGPGNYRATLSNYDGLLRGDKVRFRITAVDHGAQIVHGDLITKL